MNINNAFLVGGLVALFGMMKAGEIRAQDPQTTQFYATAPQLNPAFAGSTEENRITTFYRNQWPGIPGRYVTYGFSYDVYVPKINSGFGVVFSADEAGTGQLGSNNFGLQYAYEFKLTRKLHIRPALQFGWSSRGLLNWSALTFGDALNRDNGSGSLESLSRFELVQNFFDFGAGFLMYSENYWLGFSSRHINRPNEGFVVGATSPLPIWSSLHGGYRFEIEPRAGGPDSDLLVSFNYRHQGGFDQLDVGFHYDSHPITYGVSYRQLLWKENPAQSANHDAIALLMGYSDANWRLGYSYDFTISDLSWGVTDGGHELTLTYTWFTPSHLRKTRPRILPCAKF